MAQLTLPNAQEDREVFLREHRAGGFVEKVRRTLGTDKDLIESVRSFQGEPDALYVAVEYACEAGVPISMAADSPLNGGYD